MPVQTIPAGSRAAVRFIVCDKRSDINRVALTTAHVDQWKCDAEALARFVVAQLGLRRSRHRIDESGTRPLGLAAGDTRHQMLGLRTHGDVTLVVADTAVALADLIDFARGAYVLDTAAIRHFVDAATNRRPALHAEHDTARGPHARLAGPVPALATGLPRAEAAAPADVRRVVRPADRQAGGRGRPRREHHPQTHDGTAGARHAARLDAMGHGKAAWSSRRRSVGQAVPSGDTARRACRAICILRGHVNLITAVFIATYKYKIGETSSTSRNCSTPGTNSSPIWHSRHRRRPAGARTRPAPPPRAPRQPSASCDAPPRKGARSPGNSSRPRTGGWRRVAGHRPAVRRGLHPGPRVRAGPRSWHTRRRGGPTRPTPGTHLARPKVPRRP